MCARRRQKSFSPHARKRLNMYHYSSALLRSLRNEIPIETVVFGLLNMDRKPACKLLRFRCPRCCNFHTAINSNTNLARCFDCKKNFNPIDMVMAVGSLSFVEAVEFLKEHLKESCVGTGSN